MALIWTNPKDLDREFIRMKEAYESAALDFLSKEGEEWLAYARVNGPYRDRTGNLRNSIGYIIAQNGQIISSVFNGNIQGTEPGGDPGTAHKEGLRYAEQILRSIGQGKTYLILVAGKEYAVYVEAKKGYWVLEGVKDLIGSNIDSIKTEFKQRLKMELK